MRSYQALLLAALLLALLPGPPVYAQAIDFDRYLQLLRAAHAAAERGDRIGLEEVAPELVGARSVTLPEGGSAPADNAWLAQALDSPDPDLPAIAARLGALIDTLTAPSGPAAADAEERLRAILSRPPFTQPAQPREPGWLERFFDWFADWLSGLVRPAAQTAERSGGGLAWLLAIVGLLIVGLVLAVWARGLRRALAPPARLPSNDPEAGLSAGEAALRAGDLARAGDYRRAARLLYLSALLWLDEHGRLRYDRALTNREYLDRLGANSALHDRLRPVVDTFDRVWYGDLPLDAAEFAAYERQVEALKEP